MAKQQGCIIAVPFAATTTFPAGVVVEGRATLEAPGERCNRTRGSHPPFQQETVHSGCALTATAASEADADSILAGEVYSGQSTADSVLALLESWHCGQRQYSDGKSQGWIAITFAFKARP